MRKAYIGLSTPLFYDYGTPASKAPADKISSPNPILDSPYGLLLLFDELWFLTKSLCPENMRGLPYVHFIDEEEKLPDVSDLSYQYLMDRAKNIPDFSERYDKVSKLFNIYAQTLENMNISWAKSVDNHSHSLEIGTVDISGNSVSAENALFDIELLKRLENEKLELVTNSFGQYWLEDVNPVIKEASLTQVLVIERIPNYLTQKGPYHPIIDEARENSYLKDFRKWVSTESSTINQSELQEIKKEVEESILKVQRELFLKYLDPKSQFLSVGKTLAGSGIDLLVPGASTAASLIENWRDIRKSGSLRWQGFLVSIEK